MLRRCHLSWKVNRGWEAFRVSVQVLLGQCLVLLYLHPLLYLALFHPPRLRRHQLLRPHCPRLHHTFNLKCCTNRHILDNLRPTIATSKRSMHDAIGFDEATSSRLAQSVTCQSTLGGKDRGRGAYRGKISWRRWQFGAGINGFICKIFLDFFFDVFYCRCHCGWVRHCLLCTGFVIFWRVYDRITSRHAERPANGAKAAAYRIHATPPTMRRNAINH